MRFSLRYIILLAALSSTWRPTSAWPQPSHDLVKRELISYEERYINSRSYKHPNATVKLIGCKKIKIPAIEIEAFEDGWYANFEELRKFESHFYDPANRELRIYFPVENALVEHGDKMVEANELGEFEMYQLDGDYAVIGRYQTDHVRGVDANIIKDGVIYLAKKVLPHRRIGNIFVYDFGYKDLHDHDDHDHDLAKRKGCEKLECPSQGCVKNHDGQNCSKKFGISQGRCPFRSDVCMDYNGWATFITGCGRPTNKASRVLQFPGSDCDFSVRSGHCYNEVAAFESGELSGE